MFIYSAVCCCAPVKMGIWPPPELKELRLSRPPDQSCRQSNSKQSRDHAVSQSRDRDLFKVSSMYNKTELNRVLYN